MKLPYVSSSFAYDPQSNDRPALSAMVHRLLTKDEVNNFSLSHHVEFRSVVSADELDEIRQLHYEWFPVAYNDEFYNSLVTGGGFGGGDVITVVACMKSDVRKVIGIITVAIRRNEKQYNPNGDLMAELGFQPLDSDSCDIPTVGYILTLGVVDELRRYGVGAALLEEGIRQVEDADPICCAVFLHVIEYNKPAMQFYLRQGFTKFSVYENFYFFDDKIFAGVLFYRRVGRRMKTDIDHSITAVRALSAWIYGKLKKIFAFMQEHAHNCHVSSPKRARVLETYLV
jgi:ribosomal protein S18 acetylase RimI-like enzyme